MPYKDYDIINYIIENEPASFEERLFFYLKQWNKLSFESQRNKGETWFVKLVFQMLDDNGFLQSPYNKQKQELQSSLRKSYRYVKKHYQNWEREGGGYYIEHFERVALITLFELPHPNIKKIFISLFHDIIEDIHTDLSNIVHKSGMVGEEVAKSVLHLTKKDLRYYLTKQEKQSLNVDVWSFESSKHLRQYLVDINRFEIYENARERRNKEYFGSLKYLDDDTLDVKFADRIHNLRTLAGISPRKVVRKYVETINYFLPLSKNRNQTAFILIMVELFKIKEVIKSDKSLKKLYKKHQISKIPSECDWIVIP